MMYQASVYVRYMVLVIHSNADPVDFGRSVCVTTHTRNVKSNGKHRSSILATPRPSVACALLGVPEKVRYQDPGPNMMRICRTLLPTSIPQFCLLSRLAGSTTQTLRLHQENFASVTARRMVELRIG